MVLRSFPLGRLSIAGAVLFAATVAAAARAPEAKPEGQVDAQQTARAEAPAEERPVPPDARELVEHVQDEAAALGRLRSAYFLFKGKSTRSPEELEQMRSFAEFADGEGDAEGQVQAKDDRVSEDAVDAQEDSKVPPFLQPVVDVAVAIAWDERRFRAGLHYPAFVDFVSVFDGQRSMTLVDMKLPGGEPSQVEIAPRELMPDECWDFFPAFHTAGHSAWWRNLLIGEDESSEIYGQDPAGFLVERPRVFRANRCWELPHSDAPECRLFIGDRDRRLRRVVWLEFPDGEDVRERAGKIAGREFGNSRGIEQWFSELPEAERFEKAGALYRELGSPKKEFYFEDFQEVAPGVVIPARFGTWEKESWLGRQDYRLVASVVNKPLPDELFALPKIPEGAQVEDHEYEPSLSYVQDSKRTAEEWGAIVEGHEYEPSLSYEQDSKHTAEEWEAIVERHKRKPAEVDVPAAEQPQP